MPVRLKPVSLSLIFLFHKKITLVNVALLTKSLKVFHSGWPFFAPMMDMVNVEDDAHCHSGTSAADLAPEIVSSHHQKSESPGNIARVLRL